LNDQPNASQIQFHDRFSLLKLLATNWSKRILETWAKARVAYSLADRLLHVAIEIWIVEQCRCIPTLDLHGLDSPIVVENIRHVGTMHRFYFVICYIR